MKSHSAERGTGARPTSVPNLTWSGARPEAILNARQIRVEDIAHVLANVSWLARPSRAFYSVAQHNYLASIIVPPPHAFAALLLNVVDTLEQSLPDFFDDEDQNAADVLADFGLPDSPPLPIKCADLVLRLTEQRDLGPLGNVAPYEFADLRPLGLTIQPLPPIVAKHLFLDRFYELRPGWCDERVARAKLTRRITP